VIFERQNFASIPMEAKFQKKQRFSLTHIKTKQFISHTTYIILGVLGFWGNGALE
jgi:hypothetical protein